MKQFVIFNEQDQPVGIAPAPPANHVLMEAGIPFKNEAGQTLAPNGNYQWNLLGSSCFGGLDGRSPTSVPMSGALVGKSWDDLAAMKSAQHPHGLLREPRPETAAEIATRVQAAAAAAAEAERQRRATRVLTPLQFRRAANQLGLRDEIEALMANPQTPMDLKDYWIAGLEFQRSHPAWPQVLALMGKTEADLDALFDLGETL